MKKVSTAAAKQSGNFFRAEADDRFGPGQSCDPYIPPPSFSG
jgi:hypothetical protein